MKGRRPNRPRSPEKLPRKPLKDYWKRATPHEFTNIFQFCFSNGVQLLCVCATAQVNSRLEDFPSDTDANFDVIEEKGFGLVRSVIQEHEWLHLQEQIEPQTHVVKEVPIVQRKGFRLMSRVSDPDGPQPVTYNDVEVGGK